MRLRLAAASLPCLLGAALAAQAPRFLDTRLTPPPAGATLASELRAAGTGPRWLGYAAPGVAERQGECGVAGSAPRPRTRGRSRCSC